VSANLSFLDVNVHQKNGNDECCWFYVIYDVRSFSARNFTFTRDLICISVNVCYLGGVIGIDCHERQSWKSERQDFYEKTVKVSAHLLPLDANQILSIFSCNFFQLFT
jgi:hypothetical protein